MNKKGFMMAELVVVSAIILITLVSLYTSYNKIHSVYETRISYFDVATLYRLGYYRDVLEDNNTITNVKNTALTNGIVEVYNSIGKEDNYLIIPIEDKIDNVADRVFMIYNNKNKIDKNKFNSFSNMHVTFLEYIDYLNGKVDFSNFEYMMIMERCAINSGLVDENNCEYAYLEIFDEMIDNGETPAPEPEPVPINCSPVNSLSCRGSKKDGAAFTYDGYCKIEGNEDNWKIKFLSSGTLTTTCDIEVDVFLVGGGGGGGSSNNNGVGGGGGGGGKTTNNSTTIVANQPYKLIIGAGGSGGSEDVFETGSCGTNGKTTSGFNFKALGGGAGCPGAGGSGGSGGGGGGWGNRSSGAPGSDGGYNGRAGGSEGYSGGSGQRTSTYEFGANNGTLYSGGGGGGRGCDNVGCFDQAGNGGLGGGGAGGSDDETVNGPGKPGTANTGGGGGGGAAKHEIGGDGGSGIIIIRKKK